MLLLYDLCKVAAVDLITNIPNENIFLMEKS